MNDARTERRNPSEKAQDAESEASPAKRRQEGAGTADPGDVEKLPTIGSPEHAAGTVRAPSSAPTKDR